MYPLRMIHPQNGATHVYSAAERKTFEERGWKVQTHEEYLAVLAAKHGVAKLPENDIDPDVLAYINAAPTDAVVPIRRGPGRPRKA